MASEDFGSVISDFRESIEWNLYRWDPYILTQEMQNASHALVHQATVLTHAIHARVMNPTCDIKFSDLGDPTYADMLYSGREPASFLSSSHDDMWANKERDTTQTHPLHEIARRPLGPVICPFEEMHRVQEGNHNIPQGIDYESELGYVDDNPLQAARLYAERDLPLWQWPCKPARESLETELVLQRLATLSRRELGDLRVWTLLLKFYKEWRWTLNFRPPEFTQAVMQIYPGTHDWEGEGPPPDFQPEGPAVWLGQVGQSPVGSLPTHDIELDDELLPNGEIELHDPLEEQTQPEDQPSESSAPDLSTMRVTRSRAKKEGIEIKAGLP